MKKEMIIFINQSSCFKLSDEICWNIEKNLGRSE